MPLRTECPRCPTPLQSTTPATGVATGNGWSCPEHGPTPALRRPDEASYDEFAEVLATADRVVIAEIWAGRDPDTTIASAAKLASAVSARAATPAVAPGSVEETAAFLGREVRPHDVVLVMGGGRSYVIADMLVAALGAGG